VTGVDPSTEQPPPAREDDREPARRAAPWRDQAVARSLDAARDRAERRVQRFLDTAVELIDEKGGTDFTVQEVVERSGQSLRSFYQCFGGKQHLLLAVYEEAMVATSAEMQRTVGTEGPVLERLRRFVVTLYEWCEREPLTAPAAPHRTVRCMADFLFELLDTEPTAAAVASAPLFDQLVRLLDEGRAAGVVRDADPRRLASITLQATMFNAFGSTRRSRGTRDRAEEMWRFCLAGLDAAGAQPSS